ncbi:WecB/TagA/CpsF family glycosyltransferase [Ramlibacter sp. AW1]|uniref:WecB/TagA/CpsF family glycosyltransferase n=1 Tax=Ramlibacter aurantiacus TaxID=2801330 RepID=A0A936ZK47_9BURK|nr:WecB/TagA/CpsF family glycosyltransferase [Ramlibacter aurantiacus]MBL0422814.1 WecB/TagA/CpsF family glycosyltransferase [Ramlibacter aurantiacus]
MTDSHETVELVGMPIASLRSHELLDLIFGRLGTGRGTWLITANLDFLRRFVTDESSRALYAGADVRVADGMPLVWASWLRGTPLPERVAGASLVSPLCRRAAREQRSVFLLGGDPEAARAAAERLRAESPGLEIAGLITPRVDATPTPLQLDNIATRLRAARPDIVLVGMGSPKQERVIQALRHELPNACWIGIGVSLSFVSGHQRRAPGWMQQLGLEWLHRLFQEPQRLFRRYVLEDLPFALRLFGQSAIERLRLAPAGR